MAPADEPELSVVIALIAGGQDATATCLQALEADAAARGLECIVPYDSRLDGVAELVKRFPRVDFVDARSEVDAERFGSSSREHHDILRAIGLRHARGKIIALLEDHGTPAPGWCSAVLAGHRDAHAAIGGAVENGVDRLLNWAVYYCDFGRYQNPVPSGAVEFLSDSNVSYKREALASVRSLWAAAFHETAVNWELRRRGEMLRLDPQMVVYQTRQTLRLFPALVERYVWGRSFAGTRASELTMLRRLVLAAMSFVLPVVLSWRLVSQGFRKRRHLDRLILSLPLIFILETLWSAGELTGYLLGPPAVPRQA
jgi:hypothetical protein